MPEIPLAAMYRILRNAGAERVGESAVIELREAVELYAAEIAKKAIALARHAGRKTVKGEDVKLAIRT